jgi:hypothetical protein
MRRYSLIPANDRDWRTGRRPREWVARAQLMRKQPHSQERRRSWSTRRSHWWRRSVPLVQLARSNGRSVTRRSPAARHCAQNLSQHEIATVQTAAVEQSTGIRVRMTLTPRILMGRAPTCLGLKRPMPANNGRLNGRAPHYFRGVATLEGAGSAASHCSVSWVLKG